MSGETRRKSVGFYRLPLEGDAAIRRFIDQARAGGAGTMAEVALSLNRMRVRAPGRNRWSAAAVAKFLLAERSA
jgi:hypothetical protein